MSAECRPDWSLSVCPLNVARAGGETRTGVTPLALASFTICVMLAWKAAEVVVLSLWPNWISTQSPVAIRFFTVPHSAPLARKLAELSPLSA